VFAFHSLIQFGIALATLVLGGTRRRDDGGIDNAAFAQYRPIKIALL
jgi:hypothetical protein